MALPLNLLKSQFPIFTHRPELVYLDNAATSQKPESVIRRMNDFYERDNANTHRGLYKLSAHATQDFESVRRKVAELVGAHGPDNIAFTKGTTESINIVAHGYLQQNLKKDDQILVTAMEHHSNFIAWQQIAKRTGAALRIVPVTAGGELDLTGLSELLTTRTRMVALSHISNVLGVTNPVEEVISMSHKKNIPVLVDAAQSAGHIPIDLKRMDADFLAFSAHKMFGPMGTGVLYCKEEFSSLISPLNFGGGAIQNVDFLSTEFLDYPRNLEAGTPHVAGVVGLGAAIDFINQLDLHETTRHSRELVSYFIESSRSLGTVMFLGNPKNSGSIASFQVRGIHPHDVAGFLGDAGIAVRAGHHCAQPLMEAMGVPAVVRASFTIYNTREDVEKTIAALVELKKFWS